MSEDVRPEWKCLDCGYVWKRLTVPDIWGLKERDARGG